MQLFKLNITYFSERDGNRKTSEAQPTSQQAPIQSGHYNTSNTQKAPIQSGSGPNFDDRALLQSGHYTSTSQKAPIQSGSGPDFDDRLISKLTDAISAKLEEKYSRLQVAPTFPNWQYYETVQPTVSSSVIPEKTTPPIQFENTIEQSSLNDSFDARKLLQSVSSINKQKARALLDILEQRPNDVSFDSSGTLYINGVSLPETNMQIIFPALFKKRVKNITGLTELLEKLKEMNLLHLVSHSKKSKETSTSKESASPSTAKGNWWYLK